MPPGAARHAGVAARLPASIRARPCGERRGTLPAFARGMRHARLARNPPPARSRRSARTRARRALDGAAPGRPALLQHLTCCGRRRMRPVRRGPARHRRVDLEDLSRRPAGPPPARVRRSCGVRDGLGAEAARRRRPVACYARTRRGDHARARRAARRTRRRATLRTGDAEALARAAAAVHDGGYLAPASSKPRAPSRMRRRSSAASASPDAFVAYVDERLRILAKSHPRVEGALRNRASGARRRDLHALPAAHSDTVTWSHSDFGAAQRAGRRRHDARSRLRARHRSIRTSTSRTSSRRSPTSSARGWIPLACGGWNAPSWRATAAGRSADVRALPLAPPGVQLRVRGPARRHGVAAGMAWTAWRCAAACVLVAEVLSRRARARAA